MSAYLQKSYDAALAHAAELEEALRGVLSESDRDTLAYRQAHAVLSGDGSRVLAVVEAATNYVHTNERDASGFEFSEVRRRLWQSVKALDQMNGECDDQ